MVDLVLLASPVGFEDASSMDGTLSCWKSGRHSWAHDRGLNLKCAFPLLSLTCIPQTTSCGATVYNTVILSVYDVQTYQWWVTILEAFNMINTLPYNIVQYESMPLFTVKSLKRSSESMCSVRWYHPYARCLYLPKGMFKLAAGLETNFQHTSLSLSSTLSSELGGSCTL